MRLVAGTPWSLRSHYINANHKTNNEKRLNPLGVNVSDYVVRSDIWCRLKLNRQFQGDATEKMFNPW